MKSAIAPGEEASIVVTPARQMPAGPFEGDIIVHFEDESIEPLLLRVRGTLVPELEFDPMPAFFVATTRGRPAEVSIELINHGAEPLAPPTVEVTGDRFAARLDVLQPGRRFRITVAMSGKGAAGRETGDLVLTTSNALQSRIRLQVNTLLRERVYAFPAEIDLGAISLARLAADPAEADRRAQQLMVYQVGGRDFRIEVSTDLSFVRLGAEKSTTFTDRWQISVAIDPSKVTAWHGPGTITIHTNDAEFPVLTVPVQGSVE